MGVFVNEEGSTSLAVVLAIVLVVALMAVSLQWYWINTSGSDIQYLADMGALTAMEVIARTTKVVQMLDLMIATLNFLGLIIHAIVAISGVAMLSPAGASCVWLAPFFTKAIEFNRKFIDMRKKFSQSAFEVAQKISVVTPLVSYGYAANFVSDNAQLFEKPNNTNYRLMVVPFPLQGSLTQGAFHSEAELASSSEEANGQNVEYCERIKELEKEREAALRRAYALDVYKSPGAAFESWSISQAIQNFKTAHKSLDAEYHQVQSSILPIDTKSESARIKLEQLFSQTQESLASSFTKEVQESLGSGKLQGGSYQTSPLYLEILLDEVLNGEVHLLEHDEGERKAYHQNPSCQGLSNAQAPLSKVKISKLENDNDHPPCSICLPPHWEAASCLKRIMAGFSGNWNREAAAIADYESIQRQIEEEQELLQENTRDIFDEIINEAESILKSGRISYEPPGSRGLLSFCVSTNARKLPSYTLPFVTNSEDIELGTQFAMAGARLYPVVNSPENKDNLLSLSESIGEEGFTLGGSLYHLLDGEGGQLQALTPLWNMSAKTVTNNGSDLAVLFKDLPFGLDVIGSAFVQKLSKTLGISKPDVRAFKPALVNTAQVGSATAPGFEGAFVKSLAQAKKWHEGVSTAHLETMEGLLEETLELFPADAKQKVSSVLPAPLEYGGVSIPFNVYVSSIVSTHVAQLRSGGRSWISLMIAGAR